jgi:Na+-transporting NADH:ubiquinone oxidoreductase subunit NqrA
MKKIEVGNKVKIKNNIALNHLNSGINKLFSVEGIVKEIYIGSSRNKVAKIEWENTFNSYMYTLNAYPNTTLGRNEIERNRLKDGEYTHIHCRILEIIK